MSLYVKIRKKLEDFVLDVEFTAENEIFAVLGESGCGKSLTLKCIAGVEKPDEGRIVLNGRVLFDSQEHINVPARKRNVGYLFQDYALFPNMTVEENIGAGLKKRERGRLVSEYVRLFFLEGQEKKYPHMLSGGEKQRTALARMMIVNPEIILLDEPFSAVDSYLKWKLEQQVLEVFEKYHRTMLFVSHNRDEVYRLCERMGIIHHGRLEVTGEKREIFKNPKTKSAAILTGCKNISRMVCEKGGEVCLKDWNITKKIYKADAGQYQSIGIRAHDIRIAEEKEADAECVVERVIESPFDMIYMLRADGAEKILRFEVPKKDAPGYQKGDTVQVLLPEKSFLFLKEPDKELVEKEDIAYNV